METINKDVPCTSKNSLNPAEVSEIDYALIEAFENKAENGEDSQDETNEGSKIEEINDVPSQYCLEEAHFVESPNLLSPNKIETSSAKRKLLYVENPESKFERFAN